MTTRISRQLIPALVALPMMNSTVNAHEAGDWLLRAGIGVVDPKSDNGDVVSVDSGTTLVFNGTYMMTPNWGIELLASAPFSHDINLETGGTKVGETKHLPPTLSLQYHVSTGTAFSPYAGLARIRHRFS